MLNTNFYFANTNILVLLLIILCQTGFGQVNSDYLEETNQKALQEMADRFEKEYEQNMEKARKIARGSGMPIRRVEEDGTVIELQGLDTNTGELIYYTTTNLDAAKTTNTNEVWQGGSMSLSLSGNGYTIGEWDGAAVKSDHPDLSGSVTQIDGASSISNHATHVAGTLIGNSSGYPFTPSNSAKGMAHKASLDAYDFSNDNSEISSASGSGMLVSNHSYGQVCGWYESGGSWYWYGNKNIDASEDYSFGFYNSDASKWDEVAYNAPYYLIVKSAGNDRNDDDPNTTHYVYDYSQSQWVTSSASRNNDGNYDCITPKGTAKNIMTVGAIKDKTSSGNPVSADMTNFSSYGPADDGRIKPDIVANGYKLTSADSACSSGYCIRSGTSMSSPNAAGSMLLLQEHYNNVYGKKMRSATLKGLVIHTAIEAGSSQGPDYKFGWGLMNTKHAASVIAKDSGGQYVQENSLANGNTYTFEVYSDGNKPLKATICWTDPEGTVPSKQVDPTTKMLVNDLDLRIDPNGSNHKPYELDPNNPSNAAATQDNDVDNVEQVFVNGPSKGKHTIEVTHKGTLKDNNGNNAPQEFSLIISGAGNQWDGTAGNNWNNASNWTRGTVPGSDESIFIPKGLSNYPEITGTRKVRSLSIESGSNSKLTVKSGGKLEVKNEIINKGKNDLGDGEIVLNGSEKQIIRGDGQLEIDDLTINNPDDIELRTAFKINNKLTLTDGIIQIPGSSDSLTLADGASLNSSGGKSSSYVEGPVCKIGDEAFTFPVGDDGKWARIEISKPQQSTDAFTASYSNSGYTNTTTGSNLQNVSDVEYWNLDRVSGNSDVDITLYWEDGSNTGSNITDTQDLNIAHFNSNQSQWENKSSTTDGSSTTSSGKITSKSKVTSFSPFTFGSQSTGSTNPLPVELIHFNVKQSGQIALLKWATASEKDNSHFIVQKQTGGNWSRIGKIPGNGNATRKNTYRFRDPDFQKGTTHYYRLKQVNSDGNFEYSPIRSLYAEPNAIADLVVSPNPVKDELSLMIESRRQASYDITILGLLGKSKYKHTYAIDEGFNQLAIPMKNLHPGQYVLVIEGKQTIKRQKFLKK